MGKPLITVCMPLYNEVTTVDQAIRSVLDQSHQKYEFLICDNQSTDGSYQMVLNFLDSRIRLDQNKRNIGWRLNSNQLMASAKGKYVFTLHADDYYQNDRYFEKVIHLFDAHPNVGIVHFVYPVQFKQVFGEQELMKSKQYYSFIGSLRHVPAPSVTVYRKQAIQNSLYYAKDDWSGEARLCLHIARQGYDALIQPNYDIVRGSGWTEERIFRQRKEQIRIRYLHRLGFFIDHRNDPIISKQDLQHLEQSLQEMRKTF